MNLKNREIKKSRLRLWWVSIRILNPWVLRLWNTCAIGCAKKSAENVFNKCMSAINWYKYSGVSRTFIPHYTICVYYKSIFTVGQWIIWRSVKSGQIVVFVNFIRATAPINPDVKIVNFLFWSWNGLICIFSSSNGNLWP